MISALTCPLCETGDPGFYHRDRARSYHRCQRCALVFVPPQAWVTPEAEKARYDQHRNDPGDERYRQFLARLADPLVARVTPGSAGLDFGSGPGPVLAAMLEDAGLRVTLYDPFYAPDGTAWDRRYQFVVASEVVEHLRTPAAELTRLFAVLEPGGWLGTMTRWVDGIERFTQSRYIRDPTHIAFYSLDTWRWVAAHWDVAVEFPAPDVAFFRKAGWPRAATGRSGGGPRL